LTVRAQRERQGHGLFFAKHHAFDQAFVALEYRE